MRLRAGLDGRIVGQFDRPAGRPAVVRAHLRPGDPSRRLGPRRCPACLQHLVDQHGQRHDHDRPGNEPDDAGAGRQTGAPRLGQQRQRREVEERGRDQMMAQTGGSELMRRLALDRLPRDGSGTKRNLRRQSASPFR
jgi:hypothetical protein